MSPHRRSRRLPGAFLALVALAPGAPSAAYTIVLRGGTTIEVLGEPEYRDGRALFVVIGGSLGFLPADMVDREATALANEGRGEDDRFRDISTWREAPPSLLHPLPSPSPPPTPGPGALFPGGRTKDTFTQDDLPRRPRKRRPGERINPATALQAAEARKERLMAQLDRLEKDLRKVEAEIRDLRIEKPPAPTASPAPPATPTP